VHGLGSLYLNMESLQYVFPFSESNPLLFVRVPYLHKLPQDQIEMSHKIESKKEGLGLSTKIKVKWKLE
jgi:hypothetical protein